jgi:subtilisin family serine protease
MKNKKASILITVLLLLSTQSNLIFNSNPVQAKSVSSFEKSSSKDKKFNKRNANKRSYKNIKLEKRIVKKKSITVYRKFLDISVPFIGADTAHTSANKGKGTYVVLIDTGANVNHPMLNGRVALEACFTIMRSCPNGSNQQTGTGAAAPVDWHGSHVSGIMAGSYQQYVGVAPEAKIIAINVFDKDLSSSDVAITNALNWVNSISKNYNIAAVNMSLGTNRVYQSHCDTVSPTMTTAVKNLYDKNIAVVVAAGNSYALGMSSPACISYTVSVASMTYDGYVNDFSNLSQNTTFAAPGYRIVSAGSGTTMRSATGTSMAAPHVAGIFAIYRQMYPTHTLQQAIDRIKASSKIATDYYSSIKIPAINIATLPNIEDSPTTTSPTTTLPWINPPTTTTIPSTETTLPPVVTTTTVVSKLPLFKPTDVKIRALKNTSNYFYLSYSDSTVDKTIVNNYTLSCNDGSKFPISLELNYNSHVIKVVSNIAFTSCYLYANLENGTTSASSTPAIITYG